MTQPPYEPQQPYYPPPPMPQPVPPPKKTTGSRTLLIGVVSGAVGLVLGGAFGAAGSGPTSASPAATVTATATETETVTEPTDEPTTTKPKPTKKAAPTIETTMEDGTYEIGVDAKPGRYKTIAEDNCYWERDKDDSGELDSIIANDNVSDGARASVTVKKGEFFQSDGCGTWQLK